MNRFIVFLGVLIGSLIGRQIIAHFAYHKQRRETLARLKQVTSRK